MGNLLFWNKLCNGFEKPYRVGVYLGSFNPIHNGHLQLAKQARNQFNLDRVEIVALKKPVHKNADFIPDQDRLILNGLAVSQEPKLHASAADIELEQPTLNDLLKAYPDNPGQAKVKLVLQRTLGVLEAIKRQATQRTGQKVRLDYIVGADGLAGYPQAWQEEEFKALLKTCRLLIAPRPDAAPIKQTIRAIQKANPDIKIRYRILQVKPNPVSSTTIRRLMQQRQTIPAGLVPEPVREYLAANNILVGSGTKAAP